MNYDDKFKQLEQKMTDDLLNDSFVRTLNDLLFEHNTIFADTATLEALLELDLIDMSVLSKLLEPTDEDC